jgi:hypothetical protein
MSYVEVASKVAKWMPPHPFRHLTLRKRKKRRNLMMKRAIKDAERRIMTRFQLTYVEPIAPTADELEFIGLGYACRRLMTQAEIRAEYPNAGL